MSDFSGSRAVFLHDNDALCAVLRGWLAPWGWMCAGHGAGDAMAAAVGDGPAVILMDGAIDPATRTAWLTRLRAMAGPVAGTPVLLIADPAAPGQGGAAGRIDLPLQRDRVIAVIEHWAGPIGDHGFRDIAAPHYRLVRIAGRTAADRLLRRFADQAKGALAMLDRGENVRRVAHDMAGLAGTLGFGELGRLWSAIERDGTADADQTRTATLIVLRDIRSRIGAE